MSELSVALNDAVSVERSKSQKLVRALNNLLNAELSRTVMVSFKDEITEAVRRISLLDLSGLSDKEAEILCNSLIETLSVNHEAETTAVLSTLVSERSELATFERIEMVIRLIKALEEQGVSSKEAEGMRGVFLQHYSDDSILDPEVLSAKYE